MDHFERYASSDQCLIKTEGMIFDFLAGAFASVMPRGLLRIDKAKSRNGRCVAQILFRAMAPRVNVFNNAQTAGIMNNAREFREPWPQTIGGAFGDPDANLRFA